ncbi:MAG: recombinase family protein, partial [Peptoniphilus harei]|nr:recombinase family protein [Peptoniphilus harei]
VVGRIDKDGTVHPYDLTFYFKTGVKDSQDSNNFKDKRKMPKTMTLINCVPTRMTRIKNYVPKQKTTHAECISLISKKIK